MPKAPSITLAELAKQAGVARGTLYRHFESREELIKLAGRECIFSLNSQLMPIALEPLTGREAIEKSVEAYFTIIEKYYFLKFFWMDLEEDRQIKVHVEAYYATLGGFIRKAIEEGEIRRDLSEEFITIALDTMLYAGWEMVDKDRMDIPQASKELLSLFFDGAKP